MLLRIYNSLKAIEVQGTYIFPACANSRNLGILGISIHSCGQLDVHLSHQDIESYTVIPTFQG